MSDGQENELDEYLDHHLLPQIVCRLNSRDLVKEGRVIERSGAFPVVAMTAFLRNRRWDEFVALDDFKHIHDNVQQTTKQKGHPEQVS